MGQYELKRKTLQSGINFHGYASGRYQNESEIIVPPPPPNYIDDSFRIFADNGVEHVRVTFYWESWELNHSECYKDLIAIAEAADKYDLKCIYDNHQWECSSWLGWGVGMPNSLMSPYYDKRTGSVPDYNCIKDFWSKWWNREVKTLDGKDGWDAQLNYLRKIINILNNRSSTFGFEILNEPEVFSISDYRKVGKYHEYMLKELRNITEKPLLFCCALPHGTIDNPISQASVRPTTKDNNLICDVHAYPPSLSNMLFFKSITALMGNIPLYIGEFNSGFTKGTTLTQNQFSEYIRRFKHFGIHGWALWRWSYIEDQNIPAFNLTKIVDNRIQPGSYFKYLIKANNLVS